MTIYTDKVTGKQYDRMPGVACRECAFYADIKQCARAIEYCVSNAPGKTVCFVFKERKA